MTTKVYGSILVLIATAAFAAKPYPNVPVTSYVSDVNAGGVDYYIQSDGQVEPVNGVTGKYGRHRLEAMRRLGAKSITALVVADREVVWQILALNTEKAHN